MHLNMSSAKWRPFCLGLNELSWLKYFVRPWITADGILSYHRHYAGFSQHVDKLDDSANDCCLYTILRFCRYAMTIIWTNAGFCPRRTNNSRISSKCILEHDVVIKWKHFPRNWPFLRGIHRSPVNSPDKGQWCGALMFSLICVWINGWVNNRKAGDSRRYRSHYDVTVMKTKWH